MTLDVLAQAGSTQTPVAEAVVFWVLAPIALAAAVGMVLSRNTVHSALLLVLDFFCLAVFYAAQDAPFLAAVQVIVYAGAIMVLFLFVLMLIGVDRADSLVETLPGQRIAAVLAGLGLAGVVVGGVGGAVLDQGAVGLAEANSRGNVFAIARLLFTDYVFAFEITSALLITAAIGAMVLTHREPAQPKLTQKEMARRRFAGTHPTPLPGPGVYATDDRPAAPALLPSGAPAPGSALPGPGSGIGPTSGDRGGQGGGLGAGAP